MAVSYTHLDVYKRQEHEATNRGLELVAHVGEEVAAHLFDEVGVRAVLDEQEDVLQAQVGCSRLNDPSGVGPGACLLYTSRCV